MREFRGLVPDIIRRSYVIKFGIALLVLGLSVGAIGLIATAQVSDSVEENALQEYETLAGQEASSLDSWHARNERLVSMTAQMPVVESGDADAIRDHFNSVHLDFPSDTVNVHYVDTTSGELLVSSSSEETLSDVAFPAAGGFDSEVSRRTTVQTDAYTNHEGEPVVSYYQGVSGTENRAIVITFDLQGRTTELASRGEEDTVTTVIDSSGRIVVDDAFFGDDLESFRREYDDDHGVLAEAFEAEAGASNAVTVDGGPGQALRDAPYRFDPAGTVIAYHVTESGWIVLVHASTDEAYGFVDTVNQYGTYATLAGVLLIGLVGTVLGRNTAASIDRLTEKASRMEEGDLDVDFDTHRIDNIGRLYRGFDSMQAALKVQMEEAEAARTEAENERERVERTNQHLEHKADQYSRVMRAAGEGDLTVRMDPESRNQAMTDIAEAFNEMLAEIETTVASVTAFANEVAAASEEVTASSEEVRSASEQVTESIREISDGAERQNESLQSVTAEMETLSTTTEEIAASSNVVADIAERTAETGRDGREAAETAMEGVERLEEERESVVEEFERLESEVAEIDELIDTIAEIAEQTNMLALNANIEASRSGGEDNEGFGVVAQEVKALSGDAKEAAEEISDRLERIREQTERSAAEVDRTSEEIERVNDLVRDAVDALAEIADYAQETNSGVQEISAATEEQAASTQEVVSMVDEAATISEETTVEAENVAAAAEEQTGSLTEVSRSAGDLTDQAMQLSAALERFDTDADVDAGGSVADDGLDASPPGSGADGDADAAARDEDEELRPEESAGDEPLSDESAGDEVLSEESTGDEAATDDVFTFGGTDDG